MANKTLQFRFTPGITGLTCNVYPRAGGSVLNVSSTLVFAESTTTPGLYQAIMSDLASGPVCANVYWNGTAIGQFLSYLVEAVGNYDLLDGPSALELQSGIAAGTPVSLDGLTPAGVIAIRNALAGFPIQVPGLVQTPGH
jgi:hypothetical protein